MQGSKNVFLHLASAALLSAHPVRLHNVPRITDTGVVADIIGAAGAQVSFDGAGMDVHAADVTSGVIPPDLGGMIRPTACFGAALLARTGRAVFPMPGGDAFAVRRIDLHLEAMRAAGAEVRTANGIVSARIRTGLCGFSFDCTTPGGFGPSLGATVTALLLAASARGESRVVSPSGEPEVHATAELLRRMGVPIEAENGVLLVEGRDRLAPAAARVPADRMAAGTLLLAGAITNGRVEVEDPTLDSLPRGFVDTLADVGLKLTRGIGTIRTTPSDLHPVTVETGVHPGYPTDLQPQLVALLTQTPGTSRVLERIYAQRATHVPGLVALGADVTARGQELTITGRSRLRGTTVHGDDIRAATALVLAALAARGTTRVYGVRHLRRGYEDLADTLGALGADITEEDH
ncbi:UDP-N-acetylglucosamine 1-carboxyvinyltransferase [Nocardiopsis sp. MT53]|uniref:UDP-N-acetylglucosamine 1-carboxyvinyltransferase n=1 Tax=Nocardiopsis sp. MT53 TaxID=2865672 RepID=UPI002101E049|nr:UDP-N-acetylglucosamine 1-carboxyvinyltransferase [Nocardiopsis sp. MT53]